MVGVVPHMAGKEGEVMEGKGGRQVVKLLWSGRWWVWPHGRKVRVVKWVWQVDGGCGTWREGR